jgi:hypothetical protein
VYGSLAHAHSIIATRFPSSMAGATLPLDARHRSAALLADRIPAPACASVNAWSPSEWSPRKGVCYVRSMIPLQRNGSSLVWISRAQVHACMHGQLSTLMPSATLLKYSTE